MLHGQLKYTDAEQRTVLFQYAAHKWARHLWIPLYVAMIAGFLVLSLISHDELLLFPAGILIVAGLLYRR